MPIYVYKCDNSSCGHVIEQLESIAQHEQQPHGGNCPECEIGLLMKQVTAMARTVSRWGDTNSCRL